MVRTTPAARRAIIAAALMALGAPIPGWGQPPGEEKVQPAFAVDFVADGAVLSLTLGFGALSQAILATGEIRPQLPVLDADDLLFLDRHAAQTEGNELSGLYSDIALAAMAGYAIADTIRAGVIAGGDNAWTYLLLYAETLSVNWAVTNLSKIAVRRPRPRAYLARDRAARRGEPYEPIETDDALSFYSGHTSSTAGLAATAAYLAFVRDDRLEGWLILAGGAVLTGIVGWQRVQSREHFPTDVIAGAMAGAGVGILVPHLHRVEPASRTRIRLGALQDEDGHSGLMLHGRFW